MPFSGQQFADLNRFERWLLPADLERNARFKDGLFASTRTGLRMLGVMQIAIAVFLLHANPEIAIGILGATTLALGSLPAVRRHLRTVAILSALVVAATLIAIGIDPRLLAAALSLLFFAVVTAAPLVPLQTCLLGSAIGVIYGAAAGLAGSWDSTFQIFVLFLTCFATWASGMLYEQRRDVFEAHQRSLQIQETLTAAQSRAQLAETAMSLGRLAAALTHEINTPLGALKSAVGTMLLLSQRQSTAKPGEQERLSRAQADLSLSIESSVERLSSVVARLRRLIALEHDDKQRVNLNELLSDAALMVESKLRPEVVLAWKLQPVSDILCSTNQLTTVFSNLLTNAISAIEQTGTITVTTSQNDSLVEIEVHDNGRGMDSEDLLTIFDPGFRVENGRVLGGNWSLFTARQIVNEHGGEIWLESEPGRGTVAHVSLPALRP